MSYIKFKSPDTEILNRITEAEVFEWLSAKELQIESTGLPVSSIEIECWKRERWGIERETYYDVCCSVHAKSKLSLTKPSFKEACEDLRCELLNNPSKKAEEKRREAKRAIEEAEELEAIAKLGDL